MTRKIRSNIFETNSSSCHSISIHKGNRFFYPYNDPYYFCKDGFLHIKLAEFGWGPDEFCDFYNKLRYALCMVMETEYENYDELFDDFYFLPGFKLIEEVVKEKCNCDGIIIEPLKGYYKYGYIDHQSTEDYSCLQDFLDDYGLNIERFLFDENVVMVIDNDNH